MADDKKTCFVVMGFGLKTDYQTGRVLDLNKSYQYIIKPAAEDAGLECKRADEIVNSGLIDVPMYDQLLSADVVIADISTSNANAFYELGVRHALRPYTTITIAEDRMVFPFDVSHLTIRKYHHLGEGIDYGEAIRMKTELIGAIKTILQKPEKDSPVYTFFADLEPPVRKKIEQAVAQAAPRAIAFAAAGSSASDTASNPTVSVLMDQANQAIKNSDFVTARTLLTLVRTMAPRDPYVAQRFALATYKSKAPSPLQALEDAKAILNELCPNVSMDTETLGLWGAVHKRVWELSKDQQSLDTAIFAYEKGFYLKNDYYNGINAAYLYNLRASGSNGRDATADEVIAARIRKRVLEISNSVLQTGDLDGKPEQKYWVLATMAEAYAGLGDAAKAQEYLKQAADLGQPQWMLESTKEQLANLSKALEQFAPQPQNVR
jgi:tetratricopeptide (TPR) repeat protein